MVVLEQYRDLWLKEKMNDVIGFYPREFYCFDNFSSFKVKYDGYLYSSVEEAYQALGFKESAPDISCHSSEWRMGMDGHCLPCIF